MQLVLSVLLVAVLAGGPAAVNAPYCPEMCDENTIRPSEIPADAPKFSDYPATPLSLKHPAKPNLSDPDARRFRTMIRLEAAQGPNFAGHFTLISWGCGTDCNEFVVADAITGRIFSLPNMASVVAVNIDPDMQETPDGYVHFRLNSRLIVAFGEPNGDSKRRGIHYFVWDKTRLIESRFVSHLTDYDEDASGADKPSKANDPNKPR